MIQEHNIGTGEERTPITAEKIKILRYDEINEALKKTAYIMWKKAWSMCYHVFYNIEDAVQVMWTRLLESKKGRELIILDDISDYVGLIVTIAKRGMLDYIRSVLGREGKNDHRKGVLYTTYYMDYLEGDSDPFDIMLPAQDTSPEKAAIRNNMMKEISTFLNNRLSRRDRMIVSYVFNNKLSMKEIGEKFSITESRVSQLTGKTMKELKKEFANG